MRRVSRKKQDVSSSSREGVARAPPTVSGAVRRQHPPQEILHQQRKKHHDEVQNLTTKNYRLAKELADLRLKHRDECKQVNRLTMENMNLASRCREAISHVAMLKKELAMQQKRTAQALASQREQTKRMADSLTNSFISSSSPESEGGSQRRNSANKSSHRSSVGVEEDENVMRLVSATPSPNRDTVHHRQKIKNSNDHDDGKQSHSKLQTSAVTASESSRTKKLASSTEESRDSPATTVTTAATSPTSDLEDEIVGDNVALVSSPLSQSPEDEKNDPTKDKKTQKAPVMYSTPKKSERPKSSPFHVENCDGFDATATGKAELFPVSASPKVLNNKANSNRGKKPYDEGFPSDTIEQPESDNGGKFAKPERKMNLMNSIDAFEQSFSTDFPDSFTPKEGNNDASTTSSGSGQKIYNPFFATPEKPKSRFDSSPFSTQKEDKTTSEPSKIEYRTPPKNSNNNMPSTIDNNVQDLRPRRPEKTIPSAARARFERALGPRIESSTQSKQSTVNEVEKNASSNHGNDPGALYRRMQQRKRLDKNLESISNGSKTVGPSVVSSSSSPEQKHHTRKDIVDIVDAFEQNDRENTDNAGKAQKSSTASRFSGPIKSLRRRSVNKPISYAEPPLNTKLRRGDTFFPKTRPDTASSGDVQNQVPNVIQTTTAVVSP